MVVERQPRGANASQIRLDEFPMAFLPLLGNLVLHRIDELDVADGIGSA